MTQREQTAAEDLRAWLLHAIDRAELHASPYAHFYADNALPPDVFAALIADIPHVDRLRRNDDWKVMGAYPNRYYEQLSEMPAIASNPRVWELVNSALDHPDIPNAMAAKFAGLMPANIRERSKNGLAVRLALQVDHADSWLGPHTDSPSLFASGVLYLQCPSTADGSADTYLCVPRDPETRRQKLGPDYSRESYAHEDADSHLRVSRVPFVGNRLFVFLRSFDSLHALGPVSEQASPRKTLLIHTRYADISIRSQEDARAVAVSVGGKY